MTLNYDVPVKIDIVLNQPHMPAKWLKLMELSQQYILQGRLSIFYLYLIFNALFLFFHRTFYIINFFNFLLSFA